jgi:hypothetical protein
MPEARMRPPMPARVITVTHSGGEGSTSSKSARVASESKPSL